MTEKNISEEYLGDGLYISFDGYQARIFTYNGVTSTDEVFVEPDVAKALVHWLLRYKLIIPEEIK